VYYIVNVIPYQSSFNCSNIVQYQVQYQVLRLTNCCNSYWVHVGVYDKRQIVLGGHRFGVEAWQEHFSYYDVLRLTICSMNIRCKTCFSLEPSDCSLLKLRSRLVRLHANWHDCWISVQRLDAEWQSSCRIDTCTIVLERREYYQVLATKWKEKWVLRVSEYTVLYVQTDRVDPKGLTHFRSSRWGWPTLKWMS
jgi:hypothetical protein